MSITKKKVLVIGSGFSGLSAAALLAKEGHKVVLHEKNNTLGGRARVFSEEGFLFDMGPSWYWMPEVFEKYYNLFGYTTSDFYALKKLDPGFSVIYGKGDSIDIPNDIQDLCTLFESIETGSGKKLLEFLKEAQYKYTIGMEKLVYEPSHSLLDFATPEILSGVLRMQVFSAFSKHVRKYFTNPKLLALIEFPVLFLGAKPANTPALYSLMNYACFQLGTWYPMGGFGKVVEAFERIAREQGVEISSDSTIESLNFENKKIHSFTSNKTTENVDVVVAAADYNHVEMNLLNEAQRSYDTKYWDTRTFAPSALIFYLGVKGKVANLKHHNLFFDENFEAHAEEIYDNPKWPSKPLFYVCCPSKTDANVAPEDDENLFLLMPIATGLYDDEKTKEKYFNQMMDRLESITGEQIRNRIKVKKSYSVSNFIKDYNAFKGNAYGLANTLFQTAFFKPKLKSKKVSNLFYTGQLTVPGPGVPPTIISGQVVAAEVNKFLKSRA